MATRCPAAAEPPADRRPVIHLRPDDDPPRAVLARDGRRMGVGHGGVVLMLSEEAARAQQKAVSRCHQLRLLGIVRWQLLCGGRFPQVQEKWICLNGRSVHCLRREDRLDGLPIRPFCSWDFAAGCRLTDPDNVALSQCKFSLPTTALAILW
eukprot:GGOE01043698.1.p2 GENE.GGOE01043698.1~~GGOE01043698.1.p2  ORF type:complete len:152 (-),score=26.96 GGOE01043698.1:253-708(-)